MILISIEGIANLAHFNCGQVFAYIGIMIENTKPNTPLNDLRAIKEATTKAAQRKESAIKSLSDVKNIHKVAMERAPFSFKFFFSHN